MRLIDTQCIIKMIWLQLLASEFRNGLVDRLLSGLQFDKQADGLVIQLAVNQTIHHPTSLNLFNLHGCLFLCRTNPCLIQFQQLMGCKCSHPKSIIQARKQSAFLSTHIPSHCNLLQSAIPPLTSNSQTDLNNNIIQYEPFLILISPQTSPLSQSARQSAFGRFGWQLGLCEYFVQLLAAENRVIRVSLIQHSRKQRIAVQKTRPHGCTLSFNGFLSALCDGFANSSSFSISKNCLSISKSKAVTC